MSSVLCEGAWGAKGFKFVYANLLFVWAGSRFAEPRSSRKGDVFTFFLRRAKRTKKHAGLRPATSIQIAGRYVIFSEMTGIHQVTGFAKNCNFAGYRRQ